MAKKEPGKFTIKFNLMDPRHREVADMLESMGRSKAQFLVSTVQHYIHCDQTPNIPAPTNTDHAIIEAVVRRILSEQSGVAPTVSTQPPKKKLRQSENMSIADANELLSEETMSAIFDTLAEFKK